MNHKIKIETPTPILNTADFSFAFGGNDGKTIPTNEKGHPYFYEFVALKGMVFDVIERCSEFIFRVAHPTYPEHKIFLDRRFCSEKEIEDIPKMPSRELILKRMKNLLGKPYVWGGNWSQGIPELLLFYPPKGKIDGRTKILWTLDGIDCSGLLYEAADGLTPRNTSQLIRYGKPLRIKGLKLSKILSQLEPLDMILYKGHVLFVVDADTTIESKSPFGMIQRNAGERLDEIYKERSGMDEWSSDIDPEKQFIIRRFI